MSVCVCVCVWVCVCVRVRVCRWEWAFLSGGATLLSWALSCVCNGELRY